MKDETKKNVLRVDPGTIKTIDVRNDDEKESGPPNGQPPGREDDDHGTPPGRDAS